MCEEWDGGYFIEELFREVGHPLRSQTVLFESGVAAKEVAHAVLTPLSVGYLNEREECANFHAPPL